MKITLSERLLIGLYLVIVATVLIGLFPVMAEAYITIQPDYEQGRYAVANGGPLESLVNIRTVEFIPARGSIQLEIPDGYSVAVHQYKNKANSGFITSKTGLTGNALVPLEEQTQFIKLSIKKKKNAAILIGEGILIKLSVYTEATNIPEKTSWQSGRYAAGDGNLITSTDDIRSMLTIIDDDGYIYYYTDIYPVALSEQVPISTAIPAASMGKTNHMSWSQIAECQRNGIEVLCHTYAHPLSTKISDMTQDDFYADYSKAIEVFNAHGLNADLLVFSGSTGLYSKAQNPARQLFKGAFLAGDNCTNQAGTDPYNIKRYRIGSDYAWNVQTLDGLIDSLKESGGWMVWMMHTSDKKNYTSDVPAVLREVIDYCKAQEIPIVTAEYGFSQFCN